LVQCTISSRALAGGGVAELRETHASGNARFRSDVLNENSQIAHVHRHEGKSNGIWINRFPMNFSAGLFEDDDTEIVVPGRVFLVEPARDLLAVLDRLRVCLEIHSNTIPDRNSVLFVEIVGLHQ
jgi:hypothetical protein